MVHSSAESHFLLQMDAYPPDNIFAPGDIDHGLPPRDYSFIAYRTKINRATKRGLIR